MKPRLRAGLVCLACIATGSPWGAEAGAFPLAITALLAGEGSAAHGRLAVASHLLSAALAGGTVSLAPAATAALPAALGASLQWLVGCGLLLALQGGRLRHPPALASGGAVLAGLPAAAIATQAAVALLLLHHFARPAPGGRWHGPSRLDHKE